MFFDSQAFHTLEAGVGAAWLSQQLHSQNLANLETPNYKAKSLTFSKVLQDEQADFQVDDQGYRYTITTDENSDVRADGNNVDSDTESIELYKAYAQYSALLDKVKNQFDNYSYVMSNSPS